MIPELGRYAAEVLGAYAVSLGILAALIAAITLRGRRVRRTLDEIEGRSGRDG